MHFDISMWNPNVALEIGLAEGLGVEYYILLNRKLSKGVPADVQGLQRIEYQDPSGFKENSLIPLITRYLVKDHTHPKNVWNALGTTNRDMKYHFAMAVLAHLRDNRRLTTQDIRHLVRGTYLRQEAQNEVLELLQAQGLITPWGTKHGAKLRKNLFPDALKF